MNGAVSPITALKSDDNGAREKTWITGVSETRSTPVPKTVTVRKEILPPPPVLPKGSSNFSLVWSSLAIFLFYF